MSKIFITGGTGCIGASCIHKLLDQYADDVETIIVATRTGDPKLLRMWLGAEVDSLIASGKIVMATVDIGDKDALTASLKQYQPNRIIHLGAFQSPDCAAYPARGCEINVIGTLNLFNVAAELDQLDRFVFASSAAVYGKRAIYPGATVGEHETLAPPNLYGVWKVAGEHLAALFHEQSGVPTVSLRLNTTFGPGRDRGKTSAPTPCFSCVAPRSVFGIGKLNSAHTTFASSVPSNPTVPSEEHQLSCAETKETCGVLISLRHNSIYQQDTAQQMVARTVT